MTPSLSSPPSAPRRLPLPPRRRPLPPPLREQWRSEEAIISMLGAVVIKARGVGGGGAPAGLVVVGGEEVCARGTGRGRRGGPRERRLLFAAVVLWVRVGQRDAVAAAGRAAPL